MQGTIGLKTKVDTSGFAAGFAAAKNQLIGFGSSITATLGKIGLASLGVKTLFDTMKNVLGEPLKLSAEMESTATSFEVLLGSADKAKEVMESLKKFGKETPFEFKEVADASKKFLAFGFTTKELIPTLTNVGNLASAMGTPFAELAEVVGKMKVQNLIQGEDLNQLMGKGIPIVKELAKVMGVGEQAIKGMASNGQIEFKHVNAALANLTNGSGQMAGLMAKQSLTLGGVWSNFKDTVSQSLTKVGDEFVKFFYVKEGLNELSSFIDTASASFWELWDGITTGTSTTGEILWAYADTAYAVWESIFTGVSQFMNWIGGAISFNSTKFKDDLVYAFQYVEFVFKNLGAFFKLACYNLVYLMVKTGNQIVWVFTDVIPTALRWLKDEWGAIWNNIYEGTTALFRNLFNNIVNIIKNIPGLISGSVSLSDLWQPLMKDAQFAVIKALDIPERIKGQLETQLSDSIDAQAKALGEKYNDFRKAKDAAMAEKKNFDQVKVNDGMDGLLGTAKRENKDGYKEQKIAASGKGKQELQEAATLGSKEANASILRVLFGTKEKDPAKQTANNTKEMHKELKKVNDNLQQLLDTGVGI